MDPNAKDACICSASGIGLAVHVGCVLVFFDVEYYEIGRNLAHGGPAQFDNQVVQTASIEDKDAGAGHGMSRDRSWFLLAHEERALDAGLLPVLSGGREVVDDSVGGDGDDRPDAREVAAQNAEVQLGIGPVGKLGSRRQVSGFQIVYGIGLVVRSRDSTRTATTRLVPVPRLARGCATHGG